MKIISHRGNLMGPDPATENNPEHIKYVIFDDYDVEIDVWCIKEGKKLNWFLGHDKPQYPIEQSFLHNNRLWCHAKNHTALEEMKKMQNVHFFWHQNDDYTLTSKGYIWTYPSKISLDNSIYLLFDKDQNIPGNCFGICTDFVYHYHIDYGKKT